MSYKLYIHCVLLALFCLLSGCEEDAQCSLSSASLARFNFVDNKTHTAIKFTSGATITGSIEMNGSVETDTVFNRAESYMSVPLSYTGQTTYVIHYTETMRDTIELKHKNIPFVNDIECPAMMFFEVEDMHYTVNALDSVKLVNPKITNEDKVNFYIYYRTAGAE